MPSRRPPPGSPAWLKAQRTALGFSQPQLARVLDVSAIQIHRWERGKRPVPQLAILAVSYLILQKAA